MARHARSVVPLLAAAALAWPGPAAQVLAATPSPGSTIRLVEQRPVQVPGARLLSMSPDGRLLAALRPAVGFPHEQLCAIDIDTLADHACADLSVLDAGIREEDVTWSPDSSRLAFAERALMTLNDGDLWVMDASTGALTNLDDDGFSGRLPMLSGDRPADPISVPVSPAFSPDGTTIAYSRTLLGPDITRNTISTIAVDGGPVTDLALVADDLPGIAYFGIRWAPEGSQVYYSIHFPKGDDLRNGVWVVDATGGTPRIVAGRYQATSGPAVLGVSADGATLLVADPEAMGAYASRLPVYATVDVESGEVRPVEPVGDDPHAFVSWAGMSADGRWLLTVARLTDPDGQVRVRPTRGGAELTLAPDGLADVGPVARGLAPTWTADGRIFLTGGGAIERGTLLVVEEVPATAAP